MTDGKSTCGSQSPKWSVILVTPDVHALEWSPLTLIRVGLYDQQGMAGMIVCPIWGSVIIDIVEDALFSLRSLLGGAGCHVMRARQQPHGEAHMVRNWGLLPIPTWVKHPKSKSSSLNQACSPHSHPAIASGQTLSQSYTAKLLLNFWPIDSVRW